MCIKKSGCIVFVAAFILIATVKSSTRESVYHLPCTSAESDCNETLETIAERGRERADVHIDIKSGNLYLNTNVSFQKLNSLYINGSGVSESVINCTLSLNNAGIIIEGVENLSLNNLMLDSCGTRILIRKKTFNSALTLKKCMNINISYVVISNSNGTGLTIQQHWGGTVHIAHSNFTENKLQTSEYLPETVKAGGGVYIGDFDTDTNESIAIKFEHCSFERNEAKTRNYHSFYLNEFGHKINGSGLGGGVFVGLESDKIQSDVRVNLSYCTFIENQAFLGGGLTVKIGRGHNNTTINKVNVIVEHTKFEANGFCNKTLGGGAYIIFTKARSSTNSENECNFHNVTFLGNKAKLGGGVFVYSNGYNLSKNYLLFDNCTFEQNQAHTGSAVDLNPSSYGITSYTEYNTETVFRKCHFVHNQATTTTNPSNTQSADGIATLYANQYNVKFEVNNTFKHNDGTAIHMVNCIADFSGSNASFSGNNATQGGAVALIGTSVFLVGLGKNYTFTNNSARTQGGAIYVSTISNNDFTVSRSCFIQLFDGTKILRTKSWDTTITFNGNKAPVGGAIFATSLHPCQIINNATSDSSPYFITVEPTEVFTTRGINISSSDVATEGAHLNATQGSLRLIPGRLHDHCVTIMDDLNNTVKEPLKVTISELDNAKVRLDSNTSFVEDKIKLNGRPGSKVNLSLWTVASRQSYTTINVEFEKCPPGFQLDATNMVCKCNFDEHFGLIKCNDDFQSILTPGLWAGMYETQFVTSVCPRRFCNYNNSLTDTSTSEIKLPQKHTELETAICGTTRMGTLCGKCTPHYTTYFHSPDFRCKATSYALCHAGWLFYILSELVPTTALFIIVIVFNISFTSGAVNGFILFSQVLLSLNIDASGVITFPNQSAPIEGYQLLYGFLNLDFFTIDTLSFCLWPEATALDMLAFKYVSIVYALSLVILVVWFVNKCGGRCLGRWFRITTLKSSIIHGISAFFIICYSQAITVSYRLLSSAQLWQNINSNSSIPKVVWHNGNIAFLSKEHLPYALPALLCLLTIGVLPPIILLVYPLCNKVLAFFGLEDSRLVNFVSRKFPIGSMKPLFDSFQGCFKDNLRFFAGFYFIYRWISPIVNSATSSLGAAYVTSEILLILMLMLHALFQPYRKRVHNVVDTLLFTNLLLINTLTCVLYYLFQSQESKQKKAKFVIKTAATQAVLIYLPLFVMATYLIVIGCRRGYHLYIKRTNAQGRQSHFLQEVSQTTTGVKRRLTAAVHSMRSVKGDVNQELPRQLTLGEVSYECMF